MATIREAKTILTAEDQFSSTFAKLKAEVQGASNKFGEMKAAIVGIATGVIIGGFIAMTKHVLELADATGKGAQKAGLATEEFSKMAFAAGLMDVGVERLTKGIKFLSVMMVAASDTASHQAAIMRGLGVDVGGSVNDAMLKVADTFRALPDGAVKTALAVAVFGKAGQELIPMLNKGSEGLKKMQEEAVAFGLVINDDAAKAAEHLNENLKTLGLTTQAIGIRLVNEFAPAFARITDDMKAAYIEGGKLSALWAGWVGLQDLMFSDRFLSSLEITNREIRKLEQEMQKIMDAQKQAPGLLEMVFGKQDAALWTRLNQVSVAVSDLRVKRTGLMAVDTEAQRVAGLWKKYYDDEGKALEATTRALLGKGEAQAALAKDAANELQKLRDKGAELEQQLEMGRALTETEKVLADISAGKYEKYSKEAQLALTVEASYNDELSRQLVLRAADLSLLKDEIDAEKKLTDAMTAQKDAADKLIGSMVDRNRNLAFEITLIGKTADEIERLRAAEETRKNVLKATDETQRTLIQQQGEITQGLIAQSQELKNNATAWGNLGDAAGNFFSDLIVNTKNAFGNLWQTAKSVLVQITALFGKQIFLNIVAGASGTFGATAASAASGALNASSGSSLLGAGASALFGGTASAIGAGFSAGAAGVGGTTLGIAGNIGYGAGTAYTAISEGLAAIGPVGWIALAAVAAYAVFAQKAGGAKVGGSFQTDGNTTNLFGLQPDESTGNAAVQTIAEATSRSYAALVKSFGGTNVVSNFGLGYDSDPRGTAENRIKSLVTGINGQSIFSELDRGIGRDSKNIGPELQLSASREQLAALQVSGLQDDLAKLLGSVVAATATQFTLDALFTQASDLASVIKALAETKVPDLTLDSIRGLQRAGESLGQAFLRVAGDFLAAQGNLNQAIGARNPAFARQTTLSARNDIAQVFANAIGQNFGEELLARMALRPETFAGLNTQTMNLLTQFLTLQTTLEGLDGQLNTLGTTTQQLSAVQIVGASTLDPALLAMYEALRQAPQRLAAQTSLADYLRGSLTSSASPLNPTQQYNASRTELDRLIGLARTGDLGALGGLGAAFSTFSDFSRRQNGSNGQYNVDRSTYYNLLAGLTGGQVQPYTVQAAQAIAREQALATSSLQAEITAMKETTAALARFMADGNLIVSAPDVVDAIEGKAPAPTGNGFLQSSRSPGLA